MLSALREREREFICHTCNTLIKHRKCMVNVFSVNAGLHIISTITVFIGKLTYGALIKNLANYSAHMRACDMRNT